MSPELAALTWSAVLCVLLVLPYAVAQISTWGLRVAVGNREDTPPIPEWGNRGIRAHRNLLENFPHFAALVLVAVVAEETNDLTALGARLFLWSRVVHAAVYIAGIPWIRTLAFFAGLVGEGIIFVQLLS